MNTAVALDNVTLSYARHPAVHHATGAFAHGSLTAIAGPNGAGKSTLLKAIAGLMQPDSGTITLGLPRERVAYLPQAADLPRDFPLTVQHLVAMGGWHSSGGFKAITPELKAQVSQALVAVGLQGFEKRSIASLSAGQFQRALFARLMVQDAQLILLDEPFNAVDAPTTSHLLEIVKQWHNEKRTVICVLHDFAQIRAHFPECLLIARECIAWGSAADALSVPNLAQAMLFHETPVAHAEICQKVS
jgi:zinc/manganese transport system ATP-binding protein